MHADKFQSAHFQMAVETPDERVRLIRLAGTLDRTAAASLLRLVDAQLDLVAAGHRHLTDLLVDLESVRSFEPGGLETVRHARHSTGARGVRIHLVGCSGRLHLLPLRACQVIGEFSTFPTAEIALAELARTSSTALPGPGTARPGAPATVVHTPEQRPDGPGELTRARRHVPPSSADAAGVPPPRRSPERKPVTPRLPRADGSAQPGRSASIGFADGSHSTRRCSGPRNEVFGE
ncbi:STAS domain-containing protein [Pseudonocardia sp. KRD291]|uniref:STAS domain-containing protein n=1 Tax=Pseudonocardia sp. KRD291 TaxID=2792007 RepID=UPI001C4A27C2|nr:STAS domain-containing protein [Pseudonocardia sp. KRD291]MBW0102298.1 STAS domain-containing protein [Pseudonocardia sp. KRD291]